MADYMIYNHFRRKFMKKLKAFGKERMDIEIEELHRATKQVRERCGLQEEDSRRLRGANKPYSDKVTTEMLLWTNSKADH